MSIDRVEIDARGGGNAGILQQLHAEFEAVIGEPRDVGVDVEGTVRWRDPLESEGRERSEHQVAIVRIGADVAFEFLAAVHGDEAGMLRQGRRSEEHVADIGGGSAGHVVRRDDPAETPACHREIFRERVDDEGIARVFEHRGRVRPVGEAMIDLVGDDADVALGADGHDRGEFGLWQDRSGRVGRTGNDQAGRGWVERGDLLRRELEPGLLAACDFKRHQVQRPNRIAIGDIAGAGERDLVAGREGG